MNTKYETHLIQKDLTPAEKNSDKERFAETTNVKPIFFNEKDINAQLRYNFSKEVRNNVVKVSDITVVKFEKCSPNSLFYKTSYTDEFKEAKVLSRNSKRSIYPSDPI